MNEIKETLYQSMLIGDLTISSGTSREILEYIEKLEKQLQQKDNIIKEVREYVKENMKIVSKEQAEDTRLPVGTFMWNVDKILKMLDKGE